MARQLSWLEHPVHTRQVESSNLPLATKLLLYSYKGFFCFISLPPVCSISAASDTGLFAAANEDSGTVRNLFKLSSIHILYWKRNTISTERNLLFHACFKSWKETSCFTFVSSHGKKPLASGSCFKSNLLPPARCRPVSAGRAEDTAGGLCHEKEPLPAACGDRKGLFMNSVKTSFFHGCPFFTDVQLWIRHLPLPFQRVQRSLQHR